jgi:glucans biosynthesis protein
VPIDRRAILKGVTASTVLGLLATGGRPALAAQDNLKLGEPRAFSFDLLKDMARQMASVAYGGPDRPAPDIVPKIDYEAWGKITFDTSHALFADGPGRFPVTFFHLGKFFQKAVAMHVVEGSEAREIIYDQSYFRMPEGSLARQLPQGVGFAGFRIQEPRDGKLDWRRNDWVAFLGASYFRAIGELHQYGVSARAVAIDTAVANRQEEFPDFTQIYIECPEAEDSVTVYALLEGPSVVGVVQFVLHREKGVVMDIDHTLYARRQIERLGFAPATSMYWFSETHKTTAADWRPEVHDSDGLAIWTGWGERLWRPLNNPPRTTASSFLDENPKGFGLLQRDRVFDHYLDGVFYDRRPSLWVEPKGNWGRGVVQLIEIPTDDEIHDNIVAMWVPEQPVQPGAEYHLAYRLHWLDDEPYPTHLARCVATRLGAGGQPGQPRPKGVRKFLVEFQGGPLATLAPGEIPEMVLETSHGHFTDYKLVEPVPDDISGHWRAQFDLAGVEGTDPVELRLHLTVGGKVATETWLFQYHPF